MIPCANFLYSHHCSMLPQQGDDDALPSWGTVQEPLVLLSAAG